MNKQEVKKLLGLIIDLYPSFKLTTDTATIWAETLEDISFEHARTNLIKHVKESQFPPTIADIRGVKKRKVSTSDYCETTGQVYELYVSPNVN